MNAFRTVGVTVHGMELTGTEQNQSTQDRSAFIATVGFPILVIIGGIIGFAAPSVVAPISGWTTWLLGIVMFGMGLTLTGKDLSLIHI